MQRAFRTRILGRVVKALDLSPSGHSPRGFEPRRMQCRKHFGPVGLRPAPAVKLGVLSVAGVMVSIVAFQAVDPGSIPGPRSLFTWGNAQLDSCVARLLSLVVEHSLCKRKVGGSIPPVGCCVFCHG